MQGALPPRPETRAKRLALIAGYAAPYEPPRDPGPEPHIDVERPGELVASTASTSAACGTDGAIWQPTAIDVCSSFAWAQLVTEKGHTVSARNTSRFARRVASEPRAAGWTLERFLSDNGNEFKGQFSAVTTTLGAAHTRIHAGRPQTNGHVEALHKTILDECWRPAFARYLHPTLTGPQRELDTYPTYDNTDRVHHGRLTRGRIPADIIHRARKMQPRSPRPVDTPRSPPSLTVNSRGVHANGNSRREPREVTVHGREHVRRAASLQAGRRSSPARARHGSTSQRGVSATR